MLVMFQGPFWLKGLLIRFGQFVFIKVISSWIKIHRLNITNRKRKKNHECENKKITTKEKKVKTKETK